MLDHDVRLVRLAPLEHALPVWQSCVLRQLVAHRGRPSSRSLAQ